MPLKTILQLLWVGNIFLACAMIGMGIFTAIQLKKPAIGKQIDITERPKIVHTTKLPYEEYADIFDARVLIDPPRIQPITNPVRPQQDWHKELLQRKVRIAQIPRVGFALVSINNQEPTLLEALNEKNKKNSNKPWQIQVDGNRITALEIVPGKGIRFRFENGNREIWLEHKETNLPITTPQQNNPQNNASSAKNFESRQVSEDHWEVSAEKGTKLLQSADKHIEELAPSLEYDDDGQAIGVRLRGVKQDSEAYKLGLRKDDLIKNINGLPTNNLDPAYIERMIRTQKNSSKIEVEIIRDGQPTKIQFDVIR